MSSLNCLPNAALAAAAARLACSPSMAALLFGRSVVVLLLELLIEYTGFCPHS